jgi:hypothetical protein
MYLNLIKCISGVYNWNIKLHLEYNLNILKLNIVLSYYFIAYQKIPFYFMCFINVLKTSPKIMNLFC